MTRSVALMAAAVLSVGTVTLAGCAAQEHAHGDDEMVMECPTCKTVWVGDSKAGAAGRRIYQTESKMVCGMCDKMAAEAMTKGESALHDCPDCKTKPRLLHRTPIKPALPERG